MYIIMYMYIMICIFLHRCCFLGSLVSLHTFVIPFAKRKRKIGLLRNGYIKSAMLCPHKISPISLTK